MSANLTINPDIDITLTGRLTPECRERIKAFYLNSYGEEHAAHFDSVADQLWLPMMGGIKDQARRVGEFLNELEEHAARPN